MEHTQKSKNNRRCGGRGGGGNPKLSSIRVWARPHCAVWTVRVVRGSVKTKVNDKDDNNWRNIGKRGVRGNLKEKNNIGGCGNNESLRHHNVDGKKKGISEIESESEGTLALLWRGDWMGEEYEKQH